MATIQKFKDLIVYQKSYELSLEIFAVTRKFPKEETYSLTSQLVRASRSISANIAEGFAKRRYDLVFKKHLIDSLGSTAEVEVWLDFAVAHNYIDQREYDTFIEKLNHIGRMLTKLQQVWTNKSDSNSSEKNNLNNAKSEMANI
jgi:four helix bundle protein